MPNITLPDGSVRTYPAPVTAAQVAADISQGLAKAAVAARVDGHLVDLAHSIEGDCAFEVITFATEGLGEDIETRWPGHKVFWHTASHILAQAVKRRFPDVKLTIGPAIDGGFYYDFDSPRPFTTEDLKLLEDDMAKIAAENLPVRRFELPRGQAVELMIKRGEKYKVELIEQLPPDAVISFYEQGEFIDLCAGPHLPSTGAVRAIKLLSCTGAYWHGDSNNKMLQRIYGVAFPKAAELAEHLRQLEEARQRDHNKLGRELELFTTVDYIGQGLPILMPRGAKVIQLLERFVEDEEERRGYLLTKTPFMAKRELYQISGHWDHYRDGMFILGDENDPEVLALRPMTCPFQFQVFLAKKRSYRDLPMRLNETSTLFRNEASGEMHGLIRVRQFTISEGHIMCRPDQLQTEFSECVELANFMLRTVGLDDDVSYRFSKWDPKNKDKYIGSAAEWETVQNSMRQILDDLKIKYYEAEGEAAFYGPKLDIQIRNVFGKEDTLITIQIDFQLAERFGMEYTDADGAQKHPYVIHRTSIGCYERTLALLTEKYAGAFPLWLAPEQVRVMPISDRHEEHARSVAAALRSAGIRAEIDSRNEKIGYKIREAQLAKIPYMTVIGDKEAKSGETAVRSRKDGDIGSMAVAEFIAKLRKEIDEKAK